MHNGQLYELIKRSDKVALFSVDGGRRYDVSRIYILPQESIIDFTYKERETISSDRQFGRDGSSYCNTLEEALRYFDNLNKKLGGITEETIPPIFSNRTGDFISAETNEVLNASSGTTLHNNTGQVKPLPTIFKKNGMMYKTMVRNGNIILFSLSEGNKHFGYEVCKIRILPAQESFGNIYPERESLPIDEDFGLEGSRTFFPHEYQRAMNYFDYLTSFMQAKSQPSGNTDKIKIDQEL